MLSKFPLSSSEPTGSEKNMQVANSPGEAARLSVFRCGKQAKPRKTCKWPTSLGKWPEDRFFVAGSKRNRERFRSGTVSSLLLPRYLKCSVPRCFGDNASFETCENLMNMISKNCVMCPDSCDDFMETTSKNIKKRVRNATT